MREFAALELGRVWTAYRVSAAPAASDEKVYTYEDLAELKDKKNLHLLIHGKVYACAKFLDEHPGGDEVLISEGGKDATEAFEDVGHSDEAREILAKYYVGKGPTGKAPKPVKAASSSTAQSSTGSFNYLLPLAGLVAYFAYQYYEANIKPKA